MKTEKGITLISLVVTIIVLLILAAVTLTMLTGENGIMTRAIDAEDKYSDAYIEEQLKLAYQEYRMEKSLNTEYTIQKALNKTDLDILSIIGDDSTGYEVKVKKKSEKKIYVLNGYSSIKELSKKWIDNGNGSFTRGIVTVNLGDIVSYVLDQEQYFYDTNVNNGIGKGVISRDSVTGKYLLRQERYYKENLGYWMILGIDNNGHIELISQNPTSNRVVLANEEGYLYCSNELNKLCDDIYKHGVGAVGARSLNKEDINKLAGLETEDAIVYANSAQNKYGTIYKYRYPTKQESQSGLMQYNKNLGYGFNNNWYNISEAENQKFRMPGKEEKTELNNLNPGYSSEIKLEYYTFNITNIATKSKKYSSNILSKISQIVRGNQWIASNYMGPNDKNCNFGVLSLQNSKISGCDLFCSNSTQMVGGPLSVRPVVIIDLDVEFRKEGSKWVLDTL